MKNIIISIGILLFLAVSCSSSGDGKKVAEEFLGDDLDSISFDDLKQEVIALNAQFKFFHAFMGMGDEDKPEDYAEDEERYENEFTLSSRYEKIDFVKGIKFTQSLNYPYSSLKIDSDVKEGDGFSITYFIDRVFYSDNTSDSLDTSISSRENIALKKADSVRITVRYRYITDWEVLNISNSNKKVSFKEGTIELKNIDRNYVQYVMSDNISGRFIVGQAVSRSGKMLDRSGYVSGDLPPKEQAKKYKDLSEALTKIEKKIEDNTYDTKESLIADLYKNFGGIGDKGSDLYYRSEYYYGNANSVNLYFSKEKETEEYTFTVPVVSEIGEYNLVYNDSGNKMIVDNTGKVVVDKINKKIEQINSYYYSLLDYYNDVILYLNTTENRLDTLSPYKINNITYLTPELVQVSYRNKQGVLGKDGKFIIPLKYTSLELDDEEQAANNVIVAYKGQEVNLLDKEGNLLFSGNGIISSFTDGVAVYSTKERKPAAMINKQGKTILSLSQYTDANPFSEGLAVIEKGDKYGCIDKNGNIVIPFIYDEILDFSYGVTLVKKDDEYGIIDKNNKEVVPLSRTGGYSLSTNFGKRSYYMGGNWYDEKGQFKKED